MKKTSFLLALIFSTSFIQTTFAAEEDLSKKEACLERCSKEPRDDRKSCYRTCGDSFEPSAVVVDPTNAVRDYDRLGNAGNGPGR